MARLLITTLPTNDLGLVARALPIASLLRERGHTIWFSSPGPAPAARIAEAGFENRLPGHPIFDHLAAGSTRVGLARLLLSRRFRDRHRSRRRFLQDLVGAAPRDRAPTSEPAWDVDHAAAQMGMGSEPFVRACSEATLDLLHDLAVDAVVDLWNPFAAIAASAAGVPRASVIQADAHPRSRGFRWWLDPPAHRPSPVPAVNAVLEGLGGAAVASLSELSVGDLTLVVGSPLTDPLPAGAAVTYVGAIIGPGAKAPLPGWVAGLGRDRPLVWVYAGTPRYGSRRSGPMDSAAVVRAAVAALADLEADAVVTTGPHPLPLPRRAVPGNVHVAGHLPGVSMAEHADLLVHHGGYGSCQTGLVAATPAVIVPTHAERESNARRVAALGAATIVPLTETRRRRAVDVGRLRAAVVDALGDPQMREAAARVRDHLAGFGGAALAADRIEDLLRGAPPSETSDRHTRP